jgi:hypothetical protein
MNVSVSLTSGSVSEKNCLISFLPFALLAQSANALTASVSQPTISSPNGAATSTMAPSALKTAPMKCSQTRKLSTIVLMIGAVFETSPVADAASSSVEAKPFAKSMSSGIATLAKLTMI